LEEPRGTIVAWVVLIHEHEYLKRTDRSASSIALDNGE